MYIFTQEMIDILLSRFDKLIEAKVAKVDQIESKINSLQIEVNNRRRKTRTSKRRIKKNYPSRRWWETSHQRWYNRTWFRSLHELYAQSRKYFIDPDAQIGGDEPFKVYREMETGNTDVFSIITTPLKLIYY